MEKKGIIRCVKEILLKHEGNTSEGAIYWDSEWVGGRQIPMGMGGWRQEGGKLVSADKAFYKEMADFISLELDKAREEGKLYALDSLKDYIFINNTHRNKDLPLTWDDLRHYIKEAEQIYSEELSKLTTK